MVKFDYTHKGWDKNRPTFIASTGLGDALKRYESAKGKITKELSSYLDAARLLEAVEARRAEAVKACKSKDDARAYLESAKPDEELGFLQTQFAHKMINVLQGVHAQVDALLKHYEHRVDVLTRALPQYKANVEKGTAIEKPLAKSVKGMIDSEAPPMSQSEDLVAVLTLASKATLLKGKALGAVADKCREVSEQVKEYGELRVKALQLLDQVKRYDTRTEVDEDKLSKSNK